ncbi:MAG: xanthine dehydrogenase family protein molybdopterin-binding subunit [Defluviicoccus sp.]|nr:xanthine dehydrogenase family protein molybdopterin-binding subunit [Defluviicoccus sp.]
MAARDEADDLRALVLGRGRFVDDFDPPGCFHVYFLRSPFARARISGIDAAAARAADGVVRVLLGGDLAGVTAPVTARMDESDWYRYRPTAWPLIAGTEVRFAGEIVAAVVARDAYAAEDAAALIDIDWRPEDPVADIETALDDGAPPVHEALGGNTLFESRFVSDADADPFAEAPVVVSGRFRHPRVAPSPIECCGCLAVHDRRDDVTEIRSPTQVPHILRDGIAKFLRLPESKIRVRPTDIGGGFGVKMPLYPEEAITAFAARSIGGAVKWTQDRRQHLERGYHARDAVIEASLAADEDGRILGLKAEVRCDAGAYTPYPLGPSLEPHTALVGLPGPYAIPFIDYTSRAVATNKCPTGPYRGVGFGLCPLVTESLVDALARRIGADRIAVRRRNLVPNGAFPFRTVSGGIIDSGDYEGLLAKLLAAANIDGAEDKQGRRVGVGISCFIEPTGMGCTVFRGRGMTDVPGYDSALLRIARSGAVEAYVTTPSMGQQPFVAMRRIVAETFGIDAARVHVACADTETMPHGSGAFASRGLVSGGGALQRAASQAVDRMKQFAAVKLELDLADIVFADGRFADGRNSNRFATFEEIADFAHSPSPNLPDGLSHGLQSAATFDTPGAATSAAMHIAVGAVDTETGAVEILGYTVAEDCGTIADIDVVEGQTWGGVLQGIGAALLEEVRYDAAGQLQSASFADYTIPGAFEAPEIEIVHQETPSPITEGGYKGVGESGTIGAPAAIAGAVIDALGLECGDLRLPLTPDRVLALIAAAGRRSGA